MNTINDLIIGETDEVNIKNNIRYLTGISKIQEPGVQEETFFTKNIFGINIDLNMKNDLGLGGIQMAKVSININNNRTEDLNYIQYQTFLKETLNQFVTLVKSGNKLARDLYSKLNDKLLSVLI